MAKHSYKIPAGLNASYADLEITIQSKNGVGAKPLPVKVILMYITSIVLCFWVCSHTIVASGSILQIAAFVVLWVALTLLLVKYDRTKRVQLQIIPTLLNYIPKMSRHVITRTTNKANEFYGIAGIDSVDEKTGLVKYIDGTYGYWYRVVGSASILLFDEDRNAILNRVDSFFCKCDTDYECIFITTKESQRIYRQVTSLKQTWDDLEVKDNDLKHLVDEQFDVLKNYVGGSFKSIHQYLVLKADNKESLMMAKNVLQSEVESSSRMIKQCAALYYNDINEVLRLVYRGKE